MKYLLLFSLVLISSGCATTMMEQNVVQQFADAIEEDNEIALRRIASSDFEDKAMRSQDALRDLNTISLPQGDVEVIETEEIDDDHRWVIAADESGKKYKFELYRDPDKKRWVVNDVLVSQKKKWMRSSAKVTRSTTQVMDLVFTVREFLDVWSHGSRQEITEMASPRLAAALEPVPDPWFKSITADIAERFNKDMARKPEAQLHEDDAVVRMPIKGGHLLVSVVHHGDQWLVDDVEIHRRSDSDHTGSVRRQADAVGSLSRFLAAYEGQDQATLARYSTGEFFDGTLKFADLNLVTLPSTKSVPEEFAIQSFSGQVTVIVPSGRDVVRFDMVQTETTPTEQKTAPSDRRFQVSNVILYDRTRENQRTLTSVFTAPARTTLLVKALNTRNLPMLRQLSSSELNRMTWDRASPDVLNKLTLSLQPLQKLTVKDSNVEGRRVELTFVTPDGSEVHCRMTDENGQLKVDDIRYPNADGQTESLATQLALQIPIVEFAAAWTAGDLDRLKAASSTEFKRLVLTNYAKVPTEPAHLGRRLDAPVLSTQVAQGEATVRIGLTERTAASVQLSIREGLWAVDDVALQEPDGRTVAVKQVLRQAIVKSTLQPSRSANLSRHAVTEVPDGRPSPIRENVPIRDSAVVTASAIAETRASETGPVSGAAAINRVTTAAYEVVRPEERDVKLESSSPDTSLAQVPERLRPQDDRSGKLPESPIPLAADGMLNFGPRSPETGQNPAPPATALEETSFVELSEHPVLID